MSEIKCGSLIQISSFLGLIHFLCKYFKILTDSPCLYDCKILVTDGFIRNFVKCLWLIWREHIKYHCIRVRNAGASGRECSASLTSFSTKKSNCNFLEDVASPHCAKTSLSSTLRIISSKEDGSPYLVIADEDLTLDFEAGTPGTSNHGAGVRCFISAHEKIFRIDLWAKTRSSGVARMRERRGGPALLRKRHCAPSGGEKTNNNHSQKNACEIL